MKNMILLSKLFLINLVTKLNMPELEMGRGLIRFDVGNLRIDHVRQGVG